MGRTRIGYLSSLLVLALGCSSLATSERVATSTPAHPIWSEAELGAHLQFFNGTGSAGRLMGSPAHEVMGTYLRARMAESRLQPGLAQSFQLPYTFSLNDVLSASFGAVHTDTLSLVLGVDFLPEGRSSAGMAIVRQLVFDPVAQDVEWVDQGEGGSTVLLREENASTTYLMALQRVGVQVVLVVGMLEPRLVAHPVEGLLVVQISPGALARLLRTTPASVEALFQRPEPNRRLLPFPLRLMVGAQVRPEATAFNVLGYVPGKHPVRARDLVLVCADFDAVGAFSGMDGVDLERFGVGAATLLEVARQYGQFARYSPVPERSILFAAWSGATMEHVGLRHYLRHPLWPFDRVRAVIYVGLDPQEESRLRALLSAYDIPLYVVLPAASMRTGEARVFIRGRAARRLEQLGEPAAMRQEAPLRLATLLESAVPMARQMAEEVHALLLREAVTPGAFMPVDGDTLHVPPSG